MFEIKRAVISVYDKAGLEDLVKFLSENKVEIISTGGTKKVIENLGIDVIDISTYTESSEILDGRVKTLHPKIYGGILFKRTKLEHFETVIKKGISPIDLVVVNLYPFEKIVKKESFSRDEAIENIDIGGVTLLRAAAKNYESVAVLSNKEQYKIFIDDYVKNNRKVKEELSLSFAKEVFRVTSNYDNLITQYLNDLYKQNKSKDKDSDGLKKSLELNLDFLEELRYGENPHQKGVLFQVGKDIKTPKILNGKKLSYNNMIDIDAAFKVALEFKDSMCAAIIKHTNPCGVALSENSLAEAYEKATLSDPVSSFGSIVALTREVDEDTAKLISESFIEAVIAPSFSKNGFKILAKKKNLRLIEFPFHDFLEKNSLRETIFGWVMQEPDSYKFKEKYKEVTGISCKHVDMETLDFSIKVVKHVKSNAIVLAKGLATVGVGAGQMSRIDALEIAIKKSNGRVKGSIIASDAFFPFADCVELAAKHGVSAIVQPGGSIRDQDSIEAAKKYKTPLYFTGIRHFRH